MGPEIPDTYVPLQPLSAGGRIFARQWNQRPSLLANACNSLRAHCFLLPEECQKRLPPRSPASPAFASQVRQVEYLVSHVTHVFQVNVPTVTLRFPRLFVRGQVSLLALFLSWLSLDTRRTSSERPFQPERARTSDCLAPTNTLELCPRHYFFFLELRSACVSQDLPSFSQGIFLSSSSSAA